MDKGNIAESGTHQELIRANGAYSALYEKEIRQNEADLKTGGGEYGI